MNHWARDEQQLVDLRRQLADVRQEADKAHASEMRLRAQWTRSELLTSPLAGTPSHFGLQQQQQQQEQGRTDLLGSLGNDQQPQQPQPIDQSSLVVIAAPRESGAPTESDDVGPYHSHEDATSAPPHDTRPDMSQRQISSRIAASAVLTQAESRSLTVALSPSGSLTDSRGDTPQALLQQLLPWRFSFRQKLDQVAEPPVDSRGSGAAGDAEYDAPQRVVEVAMKQADSLASLSSMIAELAEEKRSHLRTISALQATHQSELTLTCPHLAASLHKLWGLIGCLTSFPADCSASIVPHNLYSQ
jgi:hypothetical protein